MATLDPGSVAKEVDTLEKEAKKWIEQGNTLDKLYQKQWGQFGTINGGLWEGAKEIEKLAKELADARSAFEKMSIKADALRKELQTTGKLARDMKVQLGKSVTAFKAASKDVDKLLPINKGSSLLKDAGKTCDDTLKALDKLMVTLEADAQDCEGVPKSPDMPK
jgi:chromosome segregation ATPase